MKKSLLPLILLFALFYIVGSVSAASRFRTIAGGEIYSGDLAVLAETLTIEGDATVNGDIAVLGGSAEIGGIVNGDIAVFGGSLTVRGTVNGDIAVFGGSAQIDGHVDGDIVAMGGSINLNEMAFVEGDCQAIGGILDGISTCHQTSDHEVGENADGELLYEYENDQLVPRHPQERERSHHDRPTILSTLIGSVLIAGMAYLVAKLAPQQLFRVADIAKAHPLRAGGLGLLTSLGFVLLTFILLTLSTMLLIICIGIFGYPIAIALILTYALAILMGIFAQGQLVAERLAVRYGWKRYDYAQQVALGTGIISFGLGMLLFVPLIGGAINALLSFIIVNIAIGSVVLTRFGTRNPRDYEPVLDPDKVQEAIDNMPS